MNILIRVEETKDYEEVENIIEMAFKNEIYSDNQEHNLVKRLRKSNEYIKDLSLVAVDEDKIVGYILLTKITIGNNISLALAPLSVLKEYQNKGIGKRLMKSAIEEARKLNFTSIIVLGHENYYLKFGFVKASNFNIKAPFEVPDEAFMALELKEDALKNISGVVQYSNAFFE